jgi:superfamily I DNA/RNA helicase/mRNA-degrading endonuclease RelE of RelBE toxin-antitoxin system
MSFRIADTFTASLARLSGDEQKAAKTTAFDLQLNPASPGMQFHRLERAKDKAFWSVRVGSDLRLIVHRTDASLLLCYVDHHDDAYRWAETRRLERHPTTGAAQLVELRETVREVTIPRYVEAPVDARPPAVAAATKPALFAQVPETDLLGYGVPAAWLSDVREATEDTLLALADHLPGEAAEALLELATGSTPKRAVQAPADADPFAHPDAQRRFRVMANADELARALDAPWEKWTVFLHPAQRQTVERDYAGPARVGGSAGTGKTIVALHRAVHLARTHPEARVLLATFSEPLADALRLRLRRLIGNQPSLAERLEVHAMAAIGRRIYAASLGPVTLASDEQVRAAIALAAAGVPGHRFSAYFLWSEWANVVDAWRLETWEAYRDVARLGRKTRLAEGQRALLWSIFEQVRSSLATEGLVTVPGMFHRLADKLATAKHPPFDFAVIDEAQDISVAELRFLAALGGRRPPGGDGRLSDPGGRPNALFFAGDLGQRIFQTPFSWRSLGVDVRGRSQTLRTNYRTSHQIRRLADRLLPPELADVDGNSEGRRGTVSVFNGPEPKILVLPSVAAESAAIAEWLSARAADGFAPHEIGVFVRSPAELGRATAAVRAAGLTHFVLDHRADGVVSWAGSVAVGTMHLAKGLEFRAVVVAACDDEILPLQSRIENVADDADLEDVYDTERHLLYVACTRARDQLLVTGVAPGSEFLDDLRGTSTALR